MKEIKRVCLAGEGEICLSFNDKHIRIIIIIIILHNYFVLSDMQLFFFQSFLDCVCRWQVYYIYICIGHSWKRYHG